jgi:hypothetical protein
MANKIILKRTGTQSKIPVVGDLDLGELAINTYGGRLYAKKNDGTDTIVDLTENDTVSLSGDATGSGRTAITVTLANTTVVSGTYGDVTAGVVSVPRFTVDSKGRITGVTTQSFSAAANLGTMSTQNANNVSITGGTIDGTTIGGSTRAAGSFLSVTTTNDVTVGGVLRSNDITASAISIDGDATITGNLLIQGTTTTVNSTTVAVGDLNIELAKDATSAAQANGAGITVVGPAVPATFTYNGTSNSWNVNKTLKGTDLDFTGNVAVGNLTISGTTSLAGISSSSVAATQLVYGGAGGGFKGEAAFTYNETTNTLSVDNISGSTIALSGTGSYTAGLYNTGALSVAGDASFAASMQIQSDLRVAGTIYKAGQPVLNTTDTIDGGAY